MSEILSAWAGGAFVYYFMGQYLEGDTYRLWTLLHAALWPVVVIVVAFRALRVNT